MRQCGKRVHCDFAARYAGVRAKSLMPACSVCACVLAVLLHMHMSINMLVCPLHSRACTCPLSVSLSLSLSLSVCLSLSLSLSFSLCFRWEVGTVPEPLLGGTPQHTPTHSHTLSLSLSLCFSDGKIEQFRNPYLVSLATIGAGIGANTVRV